MRDQLKAINGIRTRFVGAFVRYGKKSAYKGPDLTTVLLQNIRAIGTGESMTDHLWFSLTKGFESLGELQEGDEIQFDARVTSYIKGYRGWNEERAWENPPRTDYRLSHPTKFAKVNQTKYVAPMLTPYQEMPGWKGAQRGTE